jgi:hypothetical protein
VDIFPPSIHIYSEQEWLEGDLGISNVVFDNNTIIDPTPCGQQKLSAAACLDAPGHFITVMKGLKNISCGKNMFVAQGVTQPATTGHPGYCHPASASASASAYTPAYTYASDQL